MQQFAVILYVDIKGTNKWCWGLNLYTQPLFNQYNNGIASQAWSYLSNLVYSSTFDFMALHPPADECIFTKLPNFVTGSQNIGIST